MNTIQHGGVPITVSLPARLGKKSPRTLSVPSADSARMLSSRNNIN